MAELKSVNVTKYDAGGSGDSIISDGYIKSVEKVWIDSYVFTSALDTNDSICIGIVPAGKHITEVLVFMPSLHTLNTLSTLYLQTGATARLAGYYGTMKADGYQSITWNGATAATLRLAPASQDKEVLVGFEKLYITIQTSDADPITAASGTIRSIIRYT